MFRPISVFIGLRYLRAKKKNQFISIISAISFVGISLGVAVLITVMSVMNGFDEQIKDRMLMMIPPIKIYQLADDFSQWQSLGKKLQQTDKRITGYAPLIEQQGLLVKDSYNTFSRIEGVDPNYESRVVPIAKHITAGTFSSLQPGKFHIILGKRLAQNLGVTIGDKVLLLAPQANFTPAGLLPRLKQFTVSGIFSVSYQYNSYYAFININDAAKLYQMGHGVTALQLSIKDIYQAPFVKQKLNHGLPSYYLAQDWTDENQSFFRALHMEKTMMFFILLLIIAVAIFNLLSSLVMVVTDKQSDIAILRTLGMSSRQVITIFLVQGLMIGLIGTVIGILLGILLSVNATVIVNWIQIVFHVQFLDPSVYQINFIPSQLKMNDIVHVGIAALVLSFLATLYPAWRASRVQPVEALRYE